ncbi:hypothetical protein GFS60_06529 (plasmid) [Rhodococcus sp. WAY2]|nr:hypothetical protein GFS60_06529 [Rhodococcus sp. WAY2]
MTTATDPALPPPGMPSPVPVRSLEQLALIGCAATNPCSGTVVAVLARQPTVVARFESKRYRRGESQCAPWIGGVSSTGHGSFRAASLPGPSRRGTVPAHLFARVESPVDEVGHNLPHALACGL